MKRRTIKNILGFALACGTVLAACQRLPEKEIPEANSEERQQNLAQVKKTLTEVDKGEPNTVVRLIEHTDFRVRRAAIAKAEQLELRAPAAAEAIIKALKAQHPRVRSRAARALAKLNITAGISPMIPLLVDPDASVRLYSSKALQTFGAEGYESLLQKLSNEKYLQAHSFVLLGKKKIHLKERIVQTLAGGGTSAVPSLVTALSHEVPAVRTQVPAVIAAMGREGKNAVTPLLKALETEDQPLREAIAGSLGPLGAFDSRVVTKLQQLKNDPNRAVAKKAATSLAVVSKHEAETTRQKKARERKLKQQRARREDRKKIYDGRPKK